MSEPEPAATPDPKKKAPDLRAFFFVGIALMASGFALFSTGSSAGLALLLSGLTFIILSIPAIKEWNESRKKQ